MKKIVLLIIGVLLLAGCTNKEMVSYYENTKAGDKIKSYQLDIRIFGNFKNKVYSDFVMVDNYKGTQLKINYIKMDEELLESRIDRETKEIVDVEKSNEKESIGIEPILENPIEENISYVIDNKNYENVKGQFKEVTELTYSNPNAYLEAVSKATSVEFLKEETNGDSVSKIYTFKVAAKNMKDILEDGVLKDLTLKADVSAKVWVNKDNRINKVIYYIVDGKDKVEINVSVFRINIIRDMSNIVK